MVSPASLVLRDIATNPASGRTFTAIVATVQSRGLHLTDLHPSDIEALRDAARRPAHKQQSPKRLRVAKARFRIKDLRRKVLLKRHPKPASVPRAHTCLRAEEQLARETAARSAGKPAPAPEHCQKCEDEKKRMLLSFCVAMEVGEMES
jgi:hypothetical protein